MKLKASALLIFIVSLFPLGWYGVYSWFFTEKVLGHLIFSILFIASSLIAIWVANKPIPKAAIRKNKIRKPILIPAIIVFVPMILWLPLGLGLPALISKVLSPNEVIYTKVIEVTSRKSRRGCDHEIEFENVSSFLKSGLCVDQHLVSQFQVDDPVKLEINRNFLGIRIYAVHKPKG